MPDEHSEGSDADPPLDRYVVMSSAVGGGVDKAPSGTVTFLFTDIEGSTRLWEQHPEAMRAGLARHEACLRRAVLVSSGRVVKSTGDGLLAVFSRHSTRSSTRPLASGP
jgi:class 3 adenylate cyclase